MTWTPGAADRTFSPAWVPRPPQPISPTLIMSSLAAWTLGTQLRPAATVAPAAAVVVRRSGGLGWLVWGVCWSLRGVPPVGETGCGEIFVVGLAPLAPGGRGVGGEGAEASTPSPPGPSPPRGEGRKAA